MLPFKSRKASDLLNSTSSFTNSGAHNMSVSSSATPNAVWHPSLKNLGVAYSSSCSPVYPYGNQFLNVFHNHDQIRGGNCRYIYNSVYPNNLNAAFNAANYYVLYPNVSHLQNCQKTYQVPEEALNPEKVYLPQKMYKVVGDFGVGNSSHRTIHKEVEIPQYQYKEVEIDKVLGVPVSQTEMLKKVTTPVKVNVPIPQPRQLQIHQTVTRNVPSPVHVLTTQNYKIPKLKIDYVNVSVPIYVPHYIEVPVAAKFLLVDNLSEGIDICSSKERKDEEEEERISDSQQINSKENKNSEGFVDSTLDNNNIFDTLASNSKPPSIAMSKDFSQDLDEKNEETTKTIYDETINVEDDKRSVSDKSSSENFIEMSNNDNNPINP